MYSEKSRRKLTIRSGREVPVRVIRKVRGSLVTMVNYIDTHFGNHLKMWVFGIGTMFF